MTANDQWNETEPTTANSEDVWNEVEAEVQIAFEQMGDGFTGRLFAIDPPNANGIVQAHFTTVSDLGSVPIADDAFMNLTRDLINKFRKVPIKAFVRVQWTSNLDTGHQSGTPMRVHDVKWRN